MTVYLFGRICYKNPYIKSLTGTDSMASPQKKPDSAAPKRPALRRYFFDTEFCDEPEKFRCELISIGIVSEKNGKKADEYYGISNEFNLNAAKKQDWLQEHVLDKLDDPSTWKNLDEIRKGVLDMFEPADKIELWARNGSHDNVLICQLFGGMGEFFTLLQEQKNIGRVEFRDINELKREAGKKGLKLPRLPDKDAHIAINDARHELVCYKFLKNALRQKSNPHPAPDRNHNRKRKGRQP